jgi:hypothetical protein
MSAASCLLIVFTKGFGKPHVARLLRTHGARLGHVYQSTAREWHKWQSAHRNVSMAAPKMLDLTLNLTYGARAGDFDDKLTNDHLSSLYAITSVRRSNATYHHFVPVLRFWPDKMNIVIEANKERRRCVDILYGQYPQKAADGEAPTCIVSSLAVDKLTLEE